jgi:hypothetical protein
MPTAPLEIAAADSPPLGTLLRRVLAGACLGGLVVVAAVLASRRAGGMFAEPLSAGTLFCTGTLITSLTLIAQWPHRLFARGLTETRERRVDVADVLALGTPLFVAALLAAAMTLPGTSLGGVLLLWLPLIAAQAALVWLHRNRYRDRLADEKAASQDVAIELDAPRTELAPTAAEHSEEELSDEESSDEELSDEQLPTDVTQTWTRRIVDGVDVLEGMARVEFRAGARVTNLHVSVCPPFAAMPEVFAEATDGAAADVKVAEALTFGLRIEVRRTESGENDENAVVAVVARAAAVTAESSAA